MLNSRDAIVTVKIRCLYLVASVAIVEEGKKEQAERAKKGNPTLKKNTKKSVGQGQYDSLLNSTGKVIMTTETFYDIIEHNTNCLSHSPVS